MQQTLLISPELLEQTLNADQSVRRTGKQINDLSKIITFLRFIYFDFITVRIDSLNIYCNLKTKPRRS